MDTSTVFSEGSVYLLSGWILGTSAGFSPGPLLTIIISQSLRHGWKEGMKTATAPLITDCPIILFTLLVLYPLSDIHTILGGISLIGAGYLFYLGYESFSIQGVEISDQPANPQSIRKGVIANFFSPNPYLFWLTIGTPLMYQAAEIHWSIVVGFLLGFYVCLVGIKLFLAFIIGYSRNFLKSRLYLYINRGLGVILWLYALYFLWEAIGKFRGLG